MPDPQTTRARDDAPADGVILELLTSDPSHRPWAVAEIVREIGDQVAAIDGIGRLYRAGLLHRLDGCVFASRAALCAEEITI